MNYKYKIEQFNIEDIPVTVIDPYECKDPITVVHYHGWTSNVENQMMLGEIFGSQGIRFIMPEILGHGDRGMIRYILFRNLFYTVESTMEEYPTLINGLRERYSIDTLYISGHSMGGMIASLVVNQAEVDGLVLYNSIYDMKEYTDQLTSHKDLKYYINKKDVKAIENIRDITKSERLKDIETIINVGTRDSVIDPSFMKDFQSKIEEENIDEVIFSYYDDAEHGISYKMIRDTIEKLKEN